MWNFESGSQNTEEKNWEYKDLTSNTEAFPRLSMNVVWIDFLVFSILYIWNNLVSTMHEIATTHLYCLLRRIQRCIQWEKAVSGNDLFWPAPMKANWIVKAGRCLGLSVQSATQPSPSYPVAPGLSEGRGGKKDIKWRMICYINVIQAADWKHYQLSSWRSCCAVKLVWN